MSDLVLLVLADDAACPQAADALKAAGFTPERADASGSLATSGPAPRAIVLDGLLPEGRAFVLCREPREGPWSSVPIAWIGGPEDEWAALQVGATVFLDAPPSADDLVAHVRALAAPDEGSPQLVAGLARAREQEWEAATAELAKSPEGLLGTWSLYLSGSARVRGGELQAAAEELQALLDVQPDFWRAHVQLARMYEQAGFEREARQHLEAAQRTQPQLTEAALTEKRELPDVALPVPAEAGFDIIAADASADAPPEMPSPPPEVDLQEDDRPVVLLADDSELALAMIGAQLEDAGYRVVTALNGKQAVELAQERRPDLVVLDGLMPTMNGFDACAIIKGETGKDAPPVILLSAVYTKMRQVKEATEQYGADEMVAKSTDQADLLEAVRRLCPSTAG